MTKVTSQPHATPGTQQVPGICGLMCFLTGTDEEPRRSSGRKSSGMRLPGMPVLSCTCQNSIVNQYTALRYTALQSLWVDVATQENE